MLSLTKCLFEMRRDDFFIATIIVSYGWSLACAAVQNERESVIKISIKIWL